MTIAELQHAAWAAVEAKGLHAGEENLDVLVGMAVADRDAAARQLVAGLVAIADTAQCCGIDLEREVKKALKKTREGT